MDEDGERLDRRRRRACRPRPASRRRRRSVMRCTMSALVGAIEPDLRRQIGRADILVALAFVAVAGGAIVGEDLLAQREIGARASVGRPDSDAHVVGDGRDLGAASGCRRARTPASASRCVSWIGVPARAMVIVVLDLVERAAPEPVVGVEVGIALGALPRRRRGRARSCRRRRPALRARATASSSGVFSMSASDASGDLGVHRRARSRLQVREILHRPRARECQPRKPS